jgi:hypothetical protein
MGYYHPDQPKVFVSWQGVQTAVTNYLDCAQDWYIKNPPTTKKAPSDADVDGACSPKYDALIISLNSLTSSLESARRYAWTGWESPQDIKALLEGSRGTSSMPTTSPTPSVPSQR